MEIQGKSKRSNRKVVQEMRQNTIHTSANLTSQTVNRMHESLTLM